MFCPKCGDRLAEVDGELTCVRGKMGLSERMRNDLDECFVSRLREPPDRKFDFRWGGTWFCPGCGKPMVEEAGAICCPDCRRNISGFLKHLIDLHPHDDKV
jgi:hypothetical protein